MHRAGEGAPYTGIKSTKEKLPEAILLADKAVESGEIDPVVECIAHESAEAVRARFAAVQQKRRFDKNDLRAGREFVQAYVTYIHTVEGIHNAASTAAHAAGHDHAAPAGHDSPSHADAHASH